MFKPANLRSHSLQLVCLASLALLLVGCGAQDLYEPPGSPYTIQGLLPLPSENEGVAVLGHYAFVAGGQAGIHVIDIANPSQPVLAQTLNTLKYAESIQIIRTFTNRNLIDIALVVEGTEGITTYDVTDPVNTVSFNQGTTAVDGQKIFVQEPDDPDERFLVYLAESWKGIRIFESSPEFPGLLNYFGVFAGTQGYAMGIAVKDGYAYVADDEMGLAVLDARELVYGSVEVVSWHDTPGNALDVAVVGDYAYVADGTEGLVIFAINGPDEPVQTGSFDLSGFCKSIVVRDDLVCLAAAGGGIHFLDVSNPAKPQYLGTVSTTYANDLVLTEDGLVLVCDRDDGLVILGGRGPFSDATPPARVTSLTAAPASTEGVRLSWYSSGDDGFLGQAAACQIRYADAPIADETTWQAATAVADPPTPDTPGSQQSFVVFGLQPGTTYHFALKLVDDAGQTSLLSNSIEVTTFEGIVVQTPQLLPAYGTTLQAFTYEATYLYGSEPTVAEVIIDDTDHQALTYVSGDYGTGALYRYETTLPKGLHSYRFYFEAGDGRTAETTDAAGPAVGEIVLMMGSPDTEPGRQTDEVLHGIALSDSVLASPYEVTQQEWTDAGMAPHTGYLGGDLPAHSMTWLEAVEYCNLRSDADGRTRAYTVTGEDVSWDHQADGWRLPTEAEWEWLCRAGSETAFSGGEITETGCGIDPVLDTLGWYCGNSGTGPHSVGGKIANAFGLYDLHGNVWEWCWDWYATYSTSAVLDPTGPEFGHQRVIRGGSWFYFASDCRSASRGFYYPTSADDVVGLRVVRTIASD